MDGRYLHKFLEEVIGKYYDLGNNSTNWSRIMTYMGRVKDTLPSYYDLEGCKNIVKNYFNGLFSLCYVEEPMEECDEEPVINEEVFEPVEEEPVEENIKVIPVIPVIPVKKEEITVKKEEIQTEIKEEIINNEESSEEEPSILDGLEEGSKEWWEALSRG